MHVCTKCSVASRSTLQITLVFTAVWRLLLVVGFGSVYQWKSCLSNSLLYFSLTVNCVLYRVYFLASLKWQKKTVLVFFSFLWESFTSCGTSSCMAAKLSGLTQKKDNQMRPPVSSGWKVNGVKCFSSWKTSAYLPGNSVESLSSDCMICDCLTDRHSLNRWLRHVI